MRVKESVHVLSVIAYHRRLKQRFGRFHGAASDPLDKYLGRFRARDNQYEAPGQAVLAMALGKFPHLTVTIAN